MNKLLSTVGLFMDGRIKDGENAEGIEVQVYASKESTNK